MNTKPKKKLTCICGIDINNIFHRHRKLDFARLKEALSEHYDIIRCTAYLAIDKDSGKGFLTYLSNNGYKVEDVDKNVETNIDHILIPDMMNNMITLEADVCCLISGDEHFAPMLSILSGKGKLIHVVGASENIASPLLKIADRISYLENIQGVIPEEKKNEV